MKNKNGKNGKMNIWVILMLVGIVIGAYFLISGTGQMTLKESSVPVDLTKTKSSGNGVAVGFYNCPDDIASKSVISDEDLKLCSKVAIPDNFVTAGSIVDGSGFSIVKRTSPQTCTTVNDCYTFYQTSAGASPNMMCYGTPTKQCVLGQINTVSIGVGVTNPSSSTVAFTNVFPSSVTSTLAGVWNTAMTDKAAVTLNPGDATKTWSGNMGTLQFEGTTQTFSATITATNGFTGATAPLAPASVQLTFMANPTGSLDVSVVVPGY